MNRVYLVVGRTGSYSSASNWVVKVFGLKDRADDYCNRLNAWVKENKHDRWYEDLDGDHWFNYHCPLDPNFENDGEGTVYQVEEAEYE